MRVEMPAAHYRTHIFIRCFAGHYAEATYRAPGAWGFRWDSKRRTRLGLRFAGGRQLCGGGCGGLAATRFSMPYIQEKTYFKLYWF
jgi:hypothetical protein